MKSKKTFFLVITLLFTGFLFLLVGCNKDEDNNIDSTPSNYLVVDINDTTWNAPIISWNFSTGGTLLINGSETDENKRVTLLIPENALAGTYELTRYGSHTGWYRLSYSQQIHLMSGSYTISEHDTNNKIIFGTFYWEAQREGYHVSLTDGSFYVNYSSQ